MGNAYHLSKFSNVMSFSVLHAAIVRDFKQGGVAVEPPAPKAGLDGVDKFEIRNSKFDS